jgi:hypothetical protein
MVLLLGPAAAGSEEPSPDEMAYLAARDEYIQRFEKTWKNVAGGQAKVQQLEHDAARALTDLHERLRKIIGPLRLAGLSATERLNIETLLPDPGRDQVDGLRYGWGADDLFVTTAGLLKAYVRGHPSLPEDVAALAESGELYRNVWNWDVAQVPFAEIPIKRPTTMAVAKAFAVIGTQDSSDFPPNSILLFALRGDRVFMVFMEQRFPAIPACEKASAPYKDCYAQTLSRLPMFADAKRRVQEAVDRLK